MSQDDAADQATVRGIVAARPEPDTAAVLLLCALFLLGCFAYGYGSVHLPFGGVRYTQNLILVPPVPGAERHTLAFDATADKTLQLLFAPTHPRPADMPDEFTFDWALTPARLGAQPTMEGRVQFSGDRVRARPDDPPIAVITLPSALRGDYSIRVRPLDIGDWPDLEIYIVQASNKRFIGFAIAGIFWAVFASVGVVVFRRHRHNVRLWERIVRPTGDLPAAMAAVGEASGEQ